MWHIYSMETPRTLQEAIQYFTDFENCRQFMVAMRWPDGKVRCPKCDSEKVTYLAKARVFKCYGDHPKLKFSLKVGTVFEDSPIPLEKWLPAVWMLVNDKNGISSWELHRALGVTQKSAWFMLHRIRVAVKKHGFINPGKLGGEGKEVEVDESFVGGKVGNMHRDRRARFASERGGRGGVTGKAIVQGILDRDLREVRAKVLPDISRKTLQDEVLKNVKYGSTVYSDSTIAYDQLRYRFVHDVVDHTKQYVKGKASFITNGLENFWSLMKRGLKGTYVCVEPFHLERYVDEQAFRYNNRGSKENPMTDADRFSLALTQIIGKKIDLRRADWQERDGAPVLGASIHVAESVVPRLPRPLELLSFLFLIQVRLYFAVRNADDLLHGRLETIPSRVCFAISHSSGRLLENGTGDVLLLSASHPPSQGW